MTNSVQMTTGEAPAGATGTNDAAMAAKFDAAQAAAAGTGTPASTPAAEGERPAWLPEKFKSPEALAEAYAALESKLGGKAPAADPAKPADAPKADADPAQTAAVADALAEKGLNLADFNEEFTRDGKLSAASYEKLAKAGFSKDIVDTYTTGLQAAGQAAVSAAVTAAGDQATLDAARQWAAVSLGDRELAAYNELVATGDPAKIGTAVRDLVTQFRAAEGKDPARTVDGAGNASSSAGDAYESWAQVKEDMRKPAYQTDPAFRAKVQAKLDRSNVL